MSKAIRLVLSSLFLMIFAIPALAQDVINEGDTIEGEASDDIVEYEIELERGAVIEINIEADWDTYLEIYDEDGDMVAHDDDGGDGLQSRLVFSAPDNATYTIRVREFGGDTPSGDYELTVEAIQVIDVVDGGELEYGDSEDVDADDALSVEFTFDGDEGDEVNILATSDNYLNTTVTLFDPQGEEIAQSDNYYGDGSLRQIELDDSGTYTVQITDINNGILNGEIEIEVDLYVVSINAIELGDNGEYTVEGEASNDITEYEIELEEGSVVEINIEADWDTYLELYDEDGDMLASDDDGGDGLQSRLVFVAPDDATYIIRVRAFGGDTPPDDYELSIELIQVIDVVDGGELEYGNDEDVDADDALAVEFTFDGDEGDVIDILTTSDNYLNTIVTLFDPQGEEVAQSDNYYGDGVLRRIELEDSGTYTIQITEANSGVLNDDIEVEVTLTEVISLDDGEIEFEIGDNGEYTFVVFTAEEDVVYEVTLLLDDDPDYYDVTLHVFEEGQDIDGYADLTASMRGGTGLSYIFEANDDGEFVIRIDYYGSNDIDATMSIEVIDD